ncbi:carbohydrate ABC transporter permease [uncultured Sphaerochaeta sp.]|uniref:carbohydrate ABC transporter permease n=1 Tax=uncultured Sphaerochaeta sp. TaxID=886478 RepID=UPI002A0A71D2|nr:carbohydrate ABC transporter permease [uncultured Sphaerochaeta sp.]
MNHTRNKRKSIQTILLILLTLLCMAVCLFPIYIALLTSFKSPLQIANSIIAFPKPLYLKNYLTGLTESNFLTSLRNSALVTFPSVTFIVLIASMGGYTIARNGKRTHSIGAMEKVYLLSLMIPFQILMIPVYKMFKTLGLLNSLFGAVLFEIGYSIAYATFLYIGFVKSVPKELEEAALLDGCNPYQVFGKVVFPLLTPISSTVAALHMMWIWNDFNIALILLQKDSVRTLTVKQYYFFGQFSSNYGMAFAASLICMTPILLFFFLMQRYLVDGITAGAVKS